MSNRVPRDAHTLKISLPFKFMIYSFMIYDIPSICRLPIVLHYSWDGCFGDDPTYPTEIGGGSIRDP